MPEGDRNDGTDWRHGLRTQHAVCACGLRRAAVRDGTLAVVVLALALPAIVPSAAMVCGPRGTPPAVIERLNREIVAAIGVPAVRERFIAAGTEPGGSAPAELRERIEQEVPRWEKLLAQIGLRGK